MCRSLVAFVSLRFASTTCNYFEFWLVHCIVCVLCDWLEWLLWFWLVHCIVCVLCDWLEWLLWVLIGSLDCLCPLWLARVITLILVLRRSSENRSISKQSNDSQCTDTQCFFLCLQLLGSSFISWCGEGVVSSWRSVFSQDCTSGILLDPCNVGLLGCVPSLGVIRIRISDPRSRV